jgi:hypothetical protein
LHVRFCLEERVSENVCLRILWLGVSKSKW